MSLSKEVITPSGELMYDVRKVEEGTMSPLLKEWYPHAWLGYVNNLDDLVYHICVLLREIPRKMSYTDLCAMYFSNPYVKANVSDAFLRFLSAHLPDSIKGSKMGRDGEFYPFQPAIHPIMDLEWEKDLPTTYLACNKCSAFFCPCNLFAGIDYYYYVVLLQANNIKLAPCCLSKTIDLAPFLVSQFKKKQQEFFCTRKSIYVPKCSNNHRFLTRELNVSDTFIYPVASKQNQLVDAFACSDSYKKKIIEWDNSSRYTARDYINFVPGGIAVGEVIMEKRNYILYVDTPGSWCIVWYLVEPKHRYTPIDRAIDGVLLDQVLEKMVHNDPRPLPEIEYTPDDNEVTNLDRYYPQEYVDLMRRVNQQKEIGQYDPTYEEDRKQLTALGRHYEDLWDFALDSDHLFCCEGYTPTDLMIPSVEMSLLSVEWKEGEDFDLTPLTPQSANLDRVDIVLHLLEDLKPGNSIYHLVKIIKAMLKKKIGKAIGHLTLFLELHGLIWTNPLMVGLWKSILAWWKLNPESFAQFKGAAFSKGLTTEDITLLDKEVLTNQSIPQPPIAHLKDSTKFVQQLTADFVDSEWCESVISIGGFLLNMLAVAIVPGDIEKWVLKWGKVSQSWQKISQVSGGGTSLLRSFLGSMTGRELDPKKIKQQALIHRLGSLSVEVDKMYQALRNNLVGVLANAHALKSLQKKADDLNNDALNLEAQGLVLPALRQNLTMLYKKLEFILNFKDNIQRTTLGKMEPAVLWLGGSPGMGKSSSVPEIIKNLSNLEGRPLTTYTRNAGEQYWSGYTGQDIVIYDDFSQTLEQPEHAELISIYSTATYQVPMADLTEKGSTFQSRYVLICSNMVHVQRSATISNLEALNRRRDLVYEVTYPGGMPTNLDLNNITYTPVDPNETTVGNVPTLVIIPNKKQKINTPPQVPIATGTQVVGQAGRRQISSELYDLAQIKFRRYVKNLEAITTAFDDQLENQLFFEHEEELRYRVPLLLGPPGTGKSQLTKDKHKSDDEFLDSSKATQQKLVEAIFQSCSAEDGKWFVANQEALQEYLKDQTQDRCDSFFRRIELFTTEYKIKKNKWFGEPEYFGSEDVDWKTPDKYITYRHNDSKMTFNAFRTAVQNFQPQPDLSITRMVEPISVKDFKADVTVRLPFKVDDLAQLDPISLTKSVTVSSGKFMFGRHLKYIIKLIKLLDPYVMKDMPIGNAIVNICNAEIPTSVNLSMKVYLDDVTLAFFSYEEGTLHLAEIRPDVHWKKEMDEVYVNSKHVPRAEYELIQHVLEDTNSFDTTAFVEANVDSELYTRLAQVGALLLGAFSVSSAIAYTCGFMNSPPELKQESPAGDPRLVHKMTKPPHLHREGVAYSEHRKGKDLSRIPQRLEGKEEASIDVQSDQIRASLRKNMVSIKMGARHLAWGLVVKHGWLVTVGHLPSEGLTIQSMGKDIPLLDKQKLSNRDGAIYNFTNPHFTYANIVHHLFKYEDYSESKIRGVVSLIGKSETCVHDVIIYPATGMKREGSVDLIHDRIYNAVGKASLSTQPGDCGSLLFVKDSSYQRKVVGIHAAANTHTGQLTSIYQEDFEELTNQMNGVDLGLWNDFAARPDLAERAEKIKNQDGVEIVGTLTDVKGKSKTPYSPSGTQLRPTSYAIFFERLGEPSILSERDPRFQGPPMDLLEKSILKWNVPPSPQWDLRLLDECFEEIGEYYAQRIQGENCVIKTLSMKENLNGIPGVKESHGINRSTSPGVPWKFEKNKKSGFLNIDPYTLLATFNDDFVSSQIQDRATQLERLWSAGETTPILFDSALKDEILPMRKIYSEVKTRSFAACSFDYLLVQRKFCHSINAAIASVRRDMPIAIGMDVISHEWGDMWADMEKFSSIGFDADYSSFDATVPACVIERLAIVYNAIAQKCDPNNTSYHDRVRTNMYRSLATPYITLHQFVLKLPGGQMSGQPSTAIDNSIINLVYHLYAFKQIVKDNIFFPTIHDFNRYVLTKNYGDDVINAVKPAIADVFNFETMAQVMQGLGIKMTPSEKVSKATKIQKVLSMSFLKGYPSVQTTPLGTLILYRADASSISKQLCWTRVKKSIPYKDPMPFDFDITTMETSYLSLARHLLGVGEEEFTRTLAKVRELTKTMPDGHLIHLPEIKWETLLIETYFGRN